MYRHVGSVLISLRLPFPFPKVFGGDDVTVVPFGHQEPFLRDIDPPPPFRKDRALLVLVHA